MASQREQLISISTIRGITMNLLIESQVTPCKPDPRIVAHLLERLSSEGYEPLLSKAKQEFTKVFGGMPPKATPAEEPTPEMLFEYAYRRTITRRYREDSRVPIAGDLFYSTDGKGILYLALIVPDPSGIRRRQKEFVMEAQLEIGFIGDEANRSTLIKMTQAISQYLMETGTEAG